MLSFGWNVNTQLLPSCYFDLMKTYLNIALTSMQCLYNAPHTKPDILTSRHKVHLARPRPQRWRWAEGMSKDCQQHSATPDRTRTNFTTFSLSLSVNCSCGSVLLWQQCYILPVLWCHIFTQQSGTGDAKRSICSMTHHSPGLNKGWILPGMIVWYPQLSYFTNNLNFFITHFSSWLYTCRAGLPLKVVIRSQNAQNYATRNSRLLQWVNKLMLTSVNFLSQINRLTINEVNFYSAHLCFW